MSRTDQFDVRGPSFNKSRSSAARRCGGDAGRAAACRAAPASTPSPTAAYRTAASAAARSLCHRRLRLLCPPPHLHRPSSVSRVQAAWARPRAESERQRRNRAWTPRHAAVPATSSLPSARRRLPARAPRTRRALPSPAEERGEWREGRPAN
jgi:hypothetical protein